MQYTVRRLYADEVDTALILAWNTFLLFEAPDYGLKGVEAFKRDIIENDKFKEACRRGVNRMWGAFDGEKLVGFFGMHGKSHICLVFTDKDYHRRGIATAIFNRLINDVKAENPEVKRITLNGSPYGKPFYHHVGFVDTDVEKTVDGIRFTAMEYRIIEEERK